MSKAAVQLRDIELYGGTQMRCEIDLGLVDQYAEVWEQGKKFSGDPMLIFNDGVKLWLADGFHRYHAARKLEWRELPPDAVEIRPGTLRDAILAAVGANSEHGQRRSPDDVRRAIKTLLKDDEWGQKSAVWVAETVNCSPATVRAVRDSMGAKTEKVTGKDGKSYPSKNPRKINFSRNPLEDNTEGSKARLEDTLEQKYEPVDPSAPARNSTARERGNLWNERIDEWCRRLDVLLEEVPENPWDNDRAYDLIASRLRSAKDTLKATKFYRSCPHCAGDGCKKCNATGYMDRRMYQVAVGEDDKCPNCAGTKWDEDKEGTFCAKCHHPKGEPAGDVDEERVRTQRSKTVKTVEATMRAFDDLQLLDSNQQHGDAIQSCVGLLEIARAWK